MGVTSLRCDMKNTYREYLSIIALILLALYLWKDIKAYWTFQAKMIKAASNFPGPPALPILGNALEFIQDLDKCVDVLVRLANEYSDTWRIWVGPKLHVVMSDPKDVEIILTSPKAMKKGELYDLMAPATIESLINGSGQKYRNLRKLIMPIINGKALYTSFINSFNNQSKNFVKMLEARDNKGEFDFGDDIQYCVFDTLCDNLFGTKGTSQTDKSIDILEWNEELTCTVHARLFRAWLHPDIIFYSTATGKRHRQAMIKVHNYYDELIQRKKKIHEAYNSGAKGAEKPRVSILDLLLESESLDDFEIRNNLVPLFIGYFDTIDGLMSFMMLLLAMYPKEQVKAREEIEKVMGSDEDVTEEHLFQLKYIEMIIKETIRLFPAGPVQVRQTTEDLEIANTVLPKGVSLVMLPIVIFRSKKWWDNPDEFIPERFSPENSVNRPAFAFFPFSAGTRSCPGYKYGLVCLKVILIHLLRNYEFHSTTKLKNVELKNDVTLKAKYGYNLSIKKIDK